MDYPKLKCERFNSTSLLLSVVGGPIIDHPSAEEQWVGNVSEEGVLTIPDEVWGLLGWQGEGDTVEWLEGGDGAFYLVKIDETPESGDESDNEGNDGA